MSKQQEVTAEQIVIEQYAIEVANLRLQNAQLRIKVLEMEDDSGDAVDGEMTQ